MKTIRAYLSEKFQFLEVKFSIHLNRRFFVMADPDQTSDLGLHCLLRPVCPNN